MSGERIDRRVDLDGSVVEIERDGDRVVVTRRSADGQEATFEPADDPVLPALGRLLAPTGRDELLGQALGRPVSDTTAELVRYRAGRRATVRVGYRSPDGSPTTAFAKVFHDPAKAAAAAASLAHVTGALAPDAPVRLPAVLGLVADGALLLLEALDGDPFVLPVPLATAGPATIESFERFGVALAALHRVPRGPLPARPTDADLAKARRRVEQLGTGGLGRALAALLDELSRSADLVGPFEGELVAVHGDCKPAQVLLGRPLALLDPDHLGWGDPATDLAQLHVALLQAAIREQGADPTSPAMATIRTWIDAFDGAYFAGRSPAAAAAIATRVGWIERLTVVRKALRAETRNPGTPLALELLRVATSR